MPSFRSPRRALLFLARVVVSLPGRLYGLVVATTAAVTTTSATPTLTAVFAATTTAATRVAATTATTTGIAAAVAAPLLLPLLLPHLHLPLYAPGGGERARHHCQALSLAARNAGGLRAGAPIRRGSHRSLRAASAHHTPPAGLFMLPSCCLHVAFSCSCFSLLCL